MLFPFCQQTVPDLRRRLALEGELSLYVKEGGILRGGRGRGYARSPSLRALIPHGNLPPPLRELPTLPEPRLQQRVGFIAVGEPLGLRIPLQLAFQPHSDYAQQHPLHEGARYAEVGARRHAALAGPDPILVMALRPVVPRDRAAGQYLRRHLVVFHHRRRDQARALAVASGGYHALVSDEEASVDVLVADREGGVVGKGEGVGLPAVTIK